ncbi:TMEM175 family protein [Flavobacterium sp. NG2]|uniref:TMEM175 family protein n=1 Tax=Flavobacterium sp. NG2 TaxID=3097547 RepID=UPI002A7EBD0C|nr:TMEM175 family protein [Flavobacterium sp. NG2]WPR73044.1 TMEM175 family protein [Flavobacterium sp. NG2]
MNKNRVEAFSDGVLAIIITIMIIEIKAPHESSFDALIPLIPVFLSYVLSFTYIGIYWNNHHHLFQASKSVNGKVLWLNMHLLFWLSLIPFTTSWIGEQHFSAVPMSVYGFVLVMCAIAYFALQNKLIQLHGTDSVLKSAIKDDKKGKISLICYAVAIPLAFVAPWISGMLYIAVALLWIVPDKRIEDLINEK